MKKNVILYARVSRNEMTDSSHSIVSQIEKLTDFCDIRGWKVLQTFEDIYPNSKGFYRPGYNKLKKYVRENKSEIDYLLFVQWSRFSRNLSASLSEIENLKSLGVEVNAIEQWVDMAVPASHKTERLEVTESEFEW